MLRATPNGRLRMQGSPLAICPALNISWNDLRLHCLDRQRSTLLYRDENISFAMTLLRIDSLDRQRSTLLYRDEKRSFHDMLRATPNARVPPCHLGDFECKAPPLQFVQPLTSHEMICDYIVWIDRDLHSYIEMKRDHFMTC